MRNVYKGWKKWDICTDVALFLWLIKLIFLMVGGMFKFNHIEFTAKKKCELGAQPRIL